MISAAQWTQILLSCGVRLATAGTWGAAFAGRVQVPRFSAGRPEVVDFVAQVLHETAMLERLEENLSYSAQRLCAVWPYRFPSLEAAERYAHKPEALANFTYAGRMGNMGIGDGWRYRGRGIPMITGFDNYLLVAKLSGLPLLETPDLLSTPDCALLCGVMWWEKRIPDSAIGNVEQVTRAVQGGTLGLAERQALTDRVRAALDMFAPAKPGDLGE